MSGAETRHRSLGTKKPRFLYVGRGALLAERSHTGRSGGLLRRENAGMSSENCVRIVMAENLRFLGVGSSAQGKPGAKARPKGVVDAHTVEIL